MNTKKITSDAHNKSKAKDFKKSSRISTKKIYA